MSYSFDTDGWDLFSTPFSTSTRPASRRQQTKQTPLTAAQQPKSPPLSRQTTDTPQKPTAVQQAKPVPVGTASAPKAPAPAQADTTKPEPTASPKAPVPASTQPAAPQKELVLDISSGAAPAQDDTEKRKAHEESEAKRKAEWETKQAAKKQAEEAAIQKLQTMNDEDVIAASTARISTEVERLTRRNMKECVSEHIQELCRKDTAFARRTMHPRKNMINCFKYINRQAKDYVRQEMEDNDIKPDGGGYGCDVPDGLCYQWAEDYFNSTNAPEDQEKEEKFVPKPYTNTTPKTKKAASKTKKEDKTAKKESKDRQKTSNSYEQMTLGV